MNNYINQVVGESDKNWPPFRFPQYPAPLWAAFSTSNPRPMAEKMALPSRPIPPSTLGAFFLKARTFRGSNLPRTARRLRYRAGSNSVPDQFLGVLDAPNATATVVSASQPPLLWSPVHVSSPLLFEVRVPNPNLSHKTPHPIVPANQAPARLALPIFGDETSSTKLKEKRQAAGCSAVIPHLLLKVITTHQTHSTDEPSSRCS